MRREAETSRHLRASASAACAPSTSAVSNVTYTRVRRIERWSKAVREEAVRGVVSKCGDDGMLLPNIMSRSNSCSMEKIWRLNIVHNGVWNIFAELSGLEN